MIISNKNWLNHTIEKIIMKQQILKLFIWNVFGNQNFKEMKISEHSKLWNLKPIYV